MTTLISSIIIATGLLSNAWLGAAGDSTLPYNMKSPDTRMVLPSQLHEISGITLVKAGNLACVQDELGIVFLYDPEKKEVIRNIHFGPGGDYEDIAAVGDTLYVLRSDGLLYRLAPYTADSPAVSSYFTGIPAKNSEGLCYDDQAGRLLIAVKGRSGKGKKFRNRREVYAFDLEKHELVSKPVLTLNVENVKQDVLSRGIELPVKYKKKSKDPRTIFKFTTSAIGIHPKTRNIFLISSEDHLLMSITPAGKMLHIEQLDRLQFNKAEGITFSADGNMYISNEGQHGEPAILKFRMGSK